MPAPTVDPFRAFYDRALPAVYEYLYIRLGDPVIAAAATREAFTAVVNRWPLPPAGGNDIAAAQHAAQGVLVTAYRRQDRGARKAPAGDPAAPPGIHPTLLSLSPRERAALVLRRVDGISVSAVGRILGLRRRAAARLIDRAWRRLRRSVRKAGLSDDFDPTAELRGFSGSVEPPPRLTESLYAALRAGLDRVAVGADRSPEPPPPAPRRRRAALAVLAFVAVIAAGLALLADIDTVEPDAPLPASAPAPGSEVTSTPATASPGDVVAAAVSGAGYDFGAWTVLPVSEFDGRSGAAVARLDGELFVWGGATAGESATATGATLDLATDLWTALPPAPLPPRSGAVALWTGAEVVVAGGGPGAAAFDPVARLWRELPGAPVPDDAIAVWSGREAIFLSASSLEGAAYDPIAVRWRRLAAAPGAGWPRPKALWADDELLLWGEPISGDPAAGGPAGTVAAFDPTTDAWRLIPGPDFAVSLIRNAGLWTGDELILWGLDVARPGPEPVLRALALDPSRGEWRELAAPPFAAWAGGGLFDFHRAVWTGSRVVVWVGGDIDIGKGSELWAYDPTADRWQRSAAAPVAAADPEMLWTGGTLYAYGGRLAPLPRTLHIDLGGGGDQIPEPPGIEVVTYAHPALPFEVLALGSAGRAALISFTRSVATILEPNESLLPAAPIAAVAPLWGGWTVSSGGAVRWYRDGVMSQPIVLHPPDGRSQAGGDAPVHAVAADGTRYSEEVWLVAATADETRIARVAVIDGTTRGEVTVPGAASPVASVPGMLLLNQSAADEAEQTRDRVIVVTNPGEVEAWPGRGLGFSQEQVVWLDCAVPAERCAVVVSAPSGPGAADLVVVAAPGTLRTPEQPGVSAVSPDGRWLVVERDGSAGPGLQLVDLVEGSISELVPGRRLGAPLGPSTIWSWDAVWVLVVDGGPTAIRREDGLQVDLSEWIPTGMDIYAVRTFRSG